jgi:ATP-dependent metalloprotease
MTLRQAAHEALGLTAPGNGHTASAMNSHFSPAPAAYPSLFQSGSAPSRSLVGRTGGGGGSFFDSASLSPFGSASSSGGAGAAGGQTRPILVEVVPGRPHWLTVVGRVAYIAFILYLIYTFTRGEMGGGAGPLSQLTSGNTSAELVEMPDVCFGDVKGVDEAKKELEDVVKFLRDPEKYRRLGAKVPKGVLLTGPPGTGKTLLARAVAGEAGCRFYNRSASEFEEMLVGLGARRVRELFDNARKNSPAIIFIDEIDALGGKRKSALGSGSERQTLNQLLSSMDGFTRNENVIVIAATNAPDVLDAALTRPGRFDTTVQVDLPDVTGRKDIIDLYLRKVIHNSEIDSEMFARATPGFSGAQIEAMINQAALLAANRDASRVDVEDMEEARDKIIMGPARKGREQSKADRTLTAYHEGGHTLVGYFTKGPSNLHKVTILPRGMTGGATFYLDKDVMGMSREDILAEIDTCMGGRAAEEILLGKMKASTGASNDMRQATEYARRYIMTYSMSDLGLTSYADLKPSEGKMQIIEAEIERMLQESYTRSLGMLQARKGLLDLLANTLLDHETLTAEEVVDLVEGRPIKTVAQKLEDKEKAKGAKKSASAGSVSKPRRASRRKAKGEDEGEGAKPEQPPASGGDGGAGDAADGQDGKKKKSRWI